MIVGIILSKNYYSKYTSTEQYITLSGHICCNFTTGKDYAIAVVGSEF